MDGGQVLIGLAGILVSILGAVTVLVRNANVNADKQTAAAERQTEALKAPLEDATKAMSTMRSNLEATLTTTNTARDETISSLNAQMATLRSRLNDSEKEVSDNRTKLREVNRKTESLEDDVQDLSRKLRAATEKNVLDAASISALTLQVATLTELNRVTNEKLEKTLAALEIANAQLKLFNEQVTDLRHQLDIHGVGGTETPETIAANEVNIAADKRAAAPVESEVKEVT